MALSGLLLLGFVIMHLAGNLLIFGGPDAINGYAKKLRDLGPLLWVARGGLLVAVLAHVHTSLQLAIENRRARPERYHVERARAATMAGKTMVLSGLLVAAYLIYHLLHFTFRVTNPDLSHGTDALGRHDVYAMMVRSFQQPAITVVYVLGMTLVCLHMSHGIGSACQTLGVTRRRTVDLAARAGQGMALVIFAGYAAIPMAVWLGVIR
jgi:succinate dehydrogenase / fumarate reductase cytochrome b subunit